MGRLAVILGSNALGPGGEEIAAAAAEHGAAIVQRHGVADAPYVLPHEIDHAANLRPLVEQGCDRVLGDRLGRLAQRRAAGRQPALPRRLHRPRTSASRSSPTPAPTRRRASTRAGAAEVIEAWEAGGQAPRDGGVYWQTRRAALRDPGRDPADRRRTPTWSG